jgi:quercetin dioxygenase-like cupin family protein
MNAPETIAPVRAWSDLPLDTPMALLERHRYSGENIMLANVTLFAGCHVPTHSHENEQFAIVTSGEVRFGIGAEGSPDRYEVTVRTGEFIHLPSNVPHSADAIVDTVILDVFSPPSEKTGIDR